MDNFIHFTAILGLTLIVYFIVRWKKAKDKINDQKNKTVVILSNTDNRVRRNWIMSLQVYIIGSLAIYFGGFLFFAYHGDMTVANQIIVEGLVRTLFAVMSLAIIYCFAYVKFGTKWIGCFLIVFPIRAVFETVKELAEFFQLPGLDVTGVTYVILVYSSFISLYVYLWIHCKQLYELNRAIKARGPDQGVLMKKI
jgi:hypothetical protein